KIAAERRVAILREQGLRPTWTEIPFCSRMNVFRIEPVRHWRECAVARRVSPTLVEVGHMAVSHVRAGGDPTVPVAAGKIERQSQSGLSNYFCPSVKARSAKNIGIVGRAVAETGRHIDDRIQAGIGRRSRYRPATSPVAVAHGYIGRQGVQDVVRYRTETVLSIEEHGIP